MRSKAYGVIMAAFLIGCGSPVSSSVDHLLELYGKRAEPEVIAAAVEELFMYPKSDVADSLRSSLLTRELAPDQVIGAIDLCLRLDVHGAEALAAAVKSGANDLRLFILGGVSSGLMRNEIVWSNDAAKRFQRAAEDALSFASVEVRGHAAKVLGRLRSPDSLEHLIPMLDDRAVYLEVKSEGKLPDLFPPDIVYHLLVCDQVAIAIERITGERFNYYGRELFGLEDDDSSFRLMNREANDEAIAKMKLVLGQQGL